MSAETRLLAERIAGLFGRAFVGDGAIPDKSLSDVCGTIERMVDVREELARSEHAALAADYAAAVRALAELVGCDPTKPHWPMFCVEISLSTNAPDPDALTAARGAIEVLSTPRAVAALKEGR
jgi:hypothetical protein